MSNMILIVDDVLDWCAMLGGLITDVYPSAEVITATSLEEAKHSLARHCYALAIIDIRMDDSDEHNEDGLVLMDLIHTQCNHTSVIIVTGYGSMETVKRSMLPDVSGMRPAVDYIEKSAVHHELIRRVGEILNELGKRSVR